MPADVDSAGVYFLSVEDFERRPQTSEAAIDEERARKRESARDSPDQEDDLEPGGGSADPEPSPGAAKPDAAAPDDKSEPE